MSAAIRAVEYFLPERVVSNDDLQRAHPDWDMARIESSTGISERHVTAEGQCASDLGVAAAEKLFASGAARREDIDFLVFCTQAPDHFFPTTACLMQERLGLPRTAGAFDFNLGCAGYVLGLGLARGLIASGQARQVLLITAETGTKYITPGDRSVEPIFGDGGSATLVADAGGDGDAAGPGLGPSLYGTDGRGSPMLIVPTGGLRRPATPESPPRMFMNGREVFAFTLREVPLLVAGLLARSGLTLDDFDLFVFHQANKMMLEALAAKIGIPKEKCPIGMRLVGNTSSSSIPIALKQCLEAGTLRRGQRLMMLGFGVGYSWSGTVARWVA